MKIMDFETFAASHSASRQAFGDAGLHSPAGHIGRANWRAKMRLQSEKHHALQVRRDELRALYEQLVQSGEIRAPSYIERLRATAQGNPDRLDVQAARRLCAKKGISY